MQAQTRLPGQQVIIGITLSKLGVRVGRLGVAGGHHDQPVHLLDAPAARDELRREPIEEFGVRRLLTLRAEVSGGRNQALSEELLPHAVHGNSRCEWILRRDEPAGECEAVLGANSGQRRQHGGYVRLNVNAMLPEISANVDVGNRRLGAFGKDRGT